jgi:hypothetical protein
MHTKTPFKFLGATLACLILAACGGGAGTSAVPGSPGNNGGSSSSNDNTNTEAWRIGTGTGIDFLPTKLTAGSNINALFNGQTTTITANIVNNQAALITTPTTVTFSSPCINNKTSTITGGNVVTSIGGVAKVEYQVGTCFGDDTVTASISHNGSVSTASVTLPKLNNKKIGTGVNSSFIAGQMAASSTTLYEGDIAQITANIVDNQNALVTQPIQVTFHSECIDNGTSTIVGGNVVTSSNGVVTAQYKVGKCNSDDKVTASTANGPANSQAVIEASTTLSIDTRRMGSGFGADFTEGALEVGVGQGALAPGGVTTITAYLVNSNGDLVTDAIPVTFSSPCLSAGNASLTTTANIAAPNNTITSINGKATAVYTSKGCSGTGGVDLIKASAPFKQLVLSASANLAVKSDTAQTIVFQSANPKLINIKGTGGVETSVLTFQVLGQGGSPLKGVCVNFSPNTTAGGLALVPSKCNPAGPETYGSTTDSNGFATTTVQAGTTATAVRVTASTITDTGLIISTQSSILAVTTGIPDQNSTTLSFTNFAPAAWNHDGVTSSAVVRLADAFNNPVPDGTAVTFTTSGGAIAGSCTTIDGACPAIWKSQSPRPKPLATATFSFDADGNYIMTCSDGSPECRPGRVKVLATAIGNESFIDGNGNGLYDDIDKDTFLNSNGKFNTSTKDLPLGLSTECARSTPSSTASVGDVVGCDDLGEAYLDKNFNFIRDTIEEITDFNQNGSFDTPNGKYDGALCAGAAKANGYCTSNKVTVRDETTLVMASEHPLILANGLPPSPNLVKHISIADNTTLNYLFLLADENGNGMPAGTTVAVNTSSLSGAEAKVTLSGALGMSREPTMIQLIVKSATGATGTFVLNITSEGITTSIPIDVN